MILAPDDVVVRLSGAGRLLWLALDEPATVGEIEGFFSELDDENAGPAGDPILSAKQLTSNVSTCVDQLEELGLIEVVP